MVTLCRHFFSQVSQDAAVTWWNTVLSYYTHTIHKYEVFPGYCSSHCRMTFALAHKTQSPVWQSLPQTMEKFKLVTVHCIVNGNGNWVSELQEWLLNCLLGSSIRNYEVSIICSSMLFIIVKGPLRKLPMSQNRWAFCLSKETDHDLVNERRWVFNLSGIGGRTGGGGGLLWLIWCRQ